MTCEFSDELLSAYLDDQLSAEERAAVEAHLAAHPADRQLLAELRSVTREVQLLPTQHASADFADRVVRAALSAKSNQNGAAAVQTESAKPARGKLRRAWYAAALAGIATVAAAVIVMVSRPAGSDPGPSTVAAAAAQLAEGEALVLRVRVPAGMAPQQAIDMALAGAGIAQRASDNSSGANEVGAAYRKQLADKFGGQQPGVPNTALTHGTTTAEEAVFIEATVPHLESALAELATLSDRPLEVSPLMKVAAARPAGSNRGGGEGEGGSATGKGTGAPQEFAQHLNPRMFRLEKGASSDLPTAAPPAAKPAGNKTVRVLILVEQAN